MGKNKKIKKAIKSFEEQIKKHEKKISEYGGKKDHLKEYWKKEIKDFERQKKKREKELCKE